MCDPTFSKRFRLASLIFTAIALLLEACGTPANLIQGVSPVQPIPAINAPVSVVVTGSGNCREMEINWGDSYTTTHQGVDLSGNPTFTHTFMEWGGGKTVTVAGTIGCEGKVNTRFSMEPSVYHLAFNQIPNRPTAQTCVPTPNYFPVYSHSLVHITTIPVALAPNGINFGCPFDACTYDADGRPGSAADSSFPFAGLKEYSLVLRVSSQVVQGGTNMQFTTTDTGLLEICLNDPDMSNNNGGYEIDISIDQLGQ